MPKFTRTSALSLSAAIALGGCANMAQNEWLNQENVGTLAGAAVGILVGSQIGNGSGRTAAMIAGALAGGMLGKTIGATLDQRDREALAAQTQQALDFSQDGQSTTWTSSHSGATAQITPVSTETQSREVTVKRRAQVQAVPKMTLLNKPYQAIKSANVRSAPSTDAGKVGGLAPGSTFTAIGRTDNDWIMVGRKGVSVGYVYAPLVQPTSPAQVTSTSSSAPPQEAATDLDSLDVASAKQQGFDLDSMNVVDDKVTAQTSCRTVNYSVSAKGSQESQTVKACQAADGAWELI
ncbi:SH3 domain-containing protein [Pseudomonas benzenivorans]|uniref:SH3 domain-containing protein n=1 Tax=Pseudomonas benzenivorans TaxID=556533 RepID=A0ABZ0PWT3_9PSED|nr:SH3 domain-containing protein [Pseudomonas benzenivorans]WPC04929.1 SH3 domain-containing protein [Pseudomonas benzenivorans]